MIDVLESDYGFANARSRIRLEADSQSDDFSIYSLETSSGHPCLILAATRDSHLSECEAAVRRFLLRQQTATMAVVSDGRTHRFIRCVHGSSSCEYAGDLEHSHFDESTRPLFENVLVKADTRQASNELENAFFDAHSAIRDIDGLHADEALDELCKVIFTLTSLQNTEEVASTAHRVNREGTTIQEIAADIRGRYRHAVNTALLPSAASAFAGTINISDVAFIRVWRALSSFDLSGSSSDIKGRAFQRILDPAMRAGMGQFFTPSPVVDFVVEAVRPRVGERVLDPFCGSGHFLSRCIEIAKKNCRLNELEVSTWARNGVHGIEKSERMLRIAYADMFLHGSSRYSIQRGDSLAPFENFATLKPNTFDVVITNPPFGSLLRPDALARLGAFALAKGRGNTPLEILGLERAIQFLRPGGRLGIVLPEGVLTNQRLSYVRDWLLETIRVIAIVGLPKETFVPFGANVRTCVVVGEKLDSKKRRTASTAIVGGVERIGYDASGRPSGTQDDLSALIGAIDASFHLTETN